MLKKLSVFILIFCSISFSLFADEALAQTESNLITVVGEQTVGIGLEGNHLSSSSCVIPAGKIGKIVDVELDGESFWIGLVGKKPLKTFKTINAAKGYKLNPGTYYFYPAVSYNQLGQPKMKATVTVKIELQ